MVAAARQEVQRRSEAVCFTCADPSATCRRDASYFDTSPARSAAPATARATTTPAHRGSPAAVQGEPLSGRELIVETVEHLVRVGGQAILLLACCTTQVESCETGSTRVET